MAENSDYDAIADRQQRRAEEAMGDFLAAQPEGVRRELLNVEAVKDATLRTELMEAQGEDFLRIVKKLPPERRLRLFYPAPKASGDVGLEADAAESSACSYQADFEDVDTLADEIAEHFRFNDRQAGEIALFAEEYLRAQSERYNAWLICKIIIRLTSAENCKIAAAAMAFALDVPCVWVDGELYPSQIKAAEPLGCSRSNLSKATRLAAEFLGRDRGIHLKPPEAIEAFKVAQKAKLHWRNRVYGH